MNKQSQKDSTLENAAILASMQGSGETSTTQDRLASLLETELSERRVETLKHRELERASREANLENIRQGIKEKETKQLLCPHMKPNFASALGGQKDHRGNYHLLCQYCQKEFSGETLPQHLRLPGEMIGGPQ